MFCNTNTCSHMYKHYAHLHMLGAHIHTHTLQCTSSVVGKREEIHVPSQWLILCCCYFSMRMPLLSCDAARSHHLTILQREGP